MATPKNNPAGTVDVNMIWNRASDLHQENPLSIPSSDTLFPYKDRPCDNLDAEDDGSKDLLYIQECLSEILGDIPKLHQHQGGKWSISPQPTSKETDGLGSLSYFGIPITGRTGFTNTDSILKFVTSRTSESLHEPQPSPVQKSRSSHSTNQENIDPLKGKILRNRGYEGSFSKLEKKSLPESVSYSRDPKNLATDAASSLLIKEPKVNAVHTTPHCLKNNRVVVFESDVSQLEEKPSSKESNSLKGNIIQAEKAPSNENMRKKSLEENYLLKNVLKSKVLENKKQMQIVSPSQNVRDPVINNLGNAKERKNLPKQGSRISVFDRLDCGSNISKNTEMSLSHTAESTDNNSSKQVFRHVSLEEDSDLEIIYETVEEIDLDISFQNLSMYEEDDDGVNKSNYIVLDETIASVDESKTNITIHQTQEESVQDFRDEEDINERVNIKLANEKDPEENIDKIIETEKEKDNQKEVLPKEVSDKNVPATTTNAESKSSADTEQLNCKVTEEPSQSKEEHVEPEVIKPYMLPFISDDPEENKDNEDPRWDYMKKLETDEARYQLCRKLWKSLVVPDPNTNLTYFGFLKSPNTKNAPDSKGQKTKKRQREPEEEQSLPPKKRSRNVLSFDFTQREIEKQKRAVTRDYNNELYKRRCRQSRLRLNKAYHEKMEQLHLAQTEIIARHKFYIGLPDQNLNVCQADVEQEFKAMEHHYEKYKTIYHWNERALFV